MHAIEVLSYAHNTGERKDKRVLARVSARTVVVNLWFSLFTVFARLLAWCFLSLFTVSTHKSKKYRACAHYADDNYLMMIIR